MKEKILVLIIGILIGGILATSGFLIYNKTNSNNSSNPPQMMDSNSNGQMGFLCNYILLYCFLIFNANIKTWNI